jgi:hypothetical protein
MIKQTSENGASVTDLRISYQDLEATKSTMDSLVGEFQNIQTQQAQYDGAMGSGDVAGAMDNFAGNWDYHRKKLIGKMTDLDSMVADTLKEFQKTDSDLTKQITPKK